MKQLLRLFYGIKAFVTLTRNPDALGEVFNLSDQLSDDEKLQEIADFLAQQPGGARALLERPMVGKVDLTALAALPEGTLGRAFAEHVKALNLDLDAIPRKPSNTPLEYLQAHFYETHDIWHVVTNFGTDVAGELGLQAVYLAQFPASLASIILSAGLLNTTLFAMHERELRMDEIVRGWKMGRDARPLFGVKWNDLWAVPLEQVRAQLGIAAHPGRPITRTSAVSMGVDARAA